MSSLSVAEDGTTLGVLSPLERLYIDGRSTPPDDVREGWQAVTSNDLWPPSRRAQHLEAWYRTEFQLTDLPDTQLGIYIPRVSSIASIWLNGVEIGSTGRFDGPVTNAWNHPQLFELPGDFITVGTNTLHVRLKVIKSEMGMLHLPRVGEYAQLNKQYQRSVFFKVTASKTLSLVMAIGVTVMAIFYVALRLPASYLWFMVGSAFWVIFSLELFVVRVPMPYELWDWLVSFSMYAAAACYLAAVLRMIGLRWRKLEIVLWGLALLHPIGKLMLSPIGFSLFAFGYYCITSLLTVFIGLLLCYQGWRRRSADGAWMITAGSVITVMVFYDAFMFAFKITADFAKFPYIPLIATLSGAAIFFRRIILLNRENESMRGSIQTVDTAISTERQRLLQEIHDGVGGQLVNTLAILQRGEYHRDDIVNSVKTSLDDLRLIISSLEPVADQGDILGILATVRERLQQRLAQAGIDLQWRVKTIADVSWFDASHALQLMRILQEAITNVLKHAQARTIVISCEESALNNVAGIVIRIADDGVGLPSGDATLSRNGCQGLRSMVNRAQRLYGELAVKQKDNGTEVCLWLPVVVARAKAAV